jgi:uncharacterized protein YkwD
MAQAAAAAPLTPAESGLLRAVNAARIAHGLQALRPDPALTRAARAHSAEMLAHDTFAHGDFRGRMLGFHVTGPLTGENLAWGTGPYGVAKAVVQEWLASPEHRANLLRPGFARVGVGAAVGTFVGRTGATVVTADFAGR